MIEDNLYSNSSEKLSAFLDGELAASENSSLFYEIAQSPELQEEMKQLVSIKSMASHGLITPPSNLKDNIMAMSGLGSGVASASLFSRFFKNRVFLSSASALLTLIAAFSFSDDLFTDTSNSDNFAEERQFSYEDVPRATMNIPLTQIEAEVIEKVVYRPVYRDRIVYRDKVSDIQNSYYAYNNSPQIFNSQNDNFYLAHLENETHIPSGKYETNRPSFITGLTHGDNYTLEIRKFATWSVPEDNIHPLSNPTLNNMAISLMYEFDENQSVGIELGQEDMKMKFKGDGGTYLQNYLTFWAGVNYQYSFYNNSKISPFIRSFIGGSKVGPIFRGLAAVKYKYDPNFHVYMGLETSSLMYWYHGSTFFTNKAGVAAGVSVKF